MVLSDLLQLIDNDAEVCITDGIKLTVRCIASDAPTELYNRGVDFLAASDIGALHLRIVLDDPALYHDTF